MNYQTFASHVQSLPLIGNDILKTLGGDVGYWRVQLNRWAQQGKVLRLKRGLYTLPEDFRKTKFSLRWLANTLYSPSYLSLEFILAWYDLIPERVLTLTSVTRLKTMTFQNSLGTFSYRHLKPDLFFGFEELTDEYHHKIMAATKEKALLDTIYLSKQWEPTQTFLEENLRLQGLETLNKTRIRKYAKQFASKKMDSAAQLILKLI